jgi:homoserine kinase
VTGGRDSVRGYAPGSIGNVGPGLDILGLAVTGPGDVVTASRRELPGIAITAAGHPELPADPDRNAAGLAAREVLRRADAEAVGVSLAIEKGLPLAGGQGGSAASAVAGAVATNLLLGSPLGTADLLAASLAAEERLAGRHLDNVAPALLGGLVLVRSLDPIDVVSLPMPEELRIVLAHPEQRLHTADARAVLPAAIERPLAIYQAAQVAAMVAAFIMDDRALLSRAFDDRIAEPARAPLLPGFREAKAAALAAGALGGSISGSGPTSFALAAGDEAAGRVAAAMERAYREAGVACRARVARVDRLGAREAREVR